MSTEMILFVAIAVFALLVVGLGFTVWEFHNTIDEPSTKKGVDPNRDRESSGR